MRCVICIYFQIKNIIYIGPQKGQRYAVCITAISNLISPFFVNFDFLPLIFQNVVQVQLF